MTTSWAELTYTTSITNGCVLLSMQVLQMVVFYCPCKYYKCSCFIVHASITNGRVLLSMQVLQMVVLYCPCKLLQMVVLYCPCKYYKWSCYIVHANITNGRVILSKHNGALNFRQMQRVGLEPPIL